MTQVDGNTTIQGDVKLQYRSDIYLPPPVVYLRMNEGSGTTAADSSKAGNDLDVRNVSTLAAAETWCKGNSSCSGFTTRITPDKITGYKVSQALSQAALL